MCAPTAVLSRMCYSPSQRTSHLQPSVVLLEFMQVGTAVCWALCLAFLGLGNIEYLDHHEP
jgi:hypothetical protein